MAVVAAGGPAAGSRLETELGYGLPVGSRLIWTPRLDPALVAAGLGLTPMESRVAVLLTEGKSLREVAAETGRQETTIRWHLRQIFTKRGIARQAELVRLVLSLAGASHGRR